MITSTSHLTNTRSGELGSEPFGDCKPVAHEQHGAEADPLRACVVVSSVWLAKPCEYGATSDVRFAQSSQPIAGMRPTKHVGFPTPPPVSRPRVDERFAIRGAGRQNLWLRHLLLFMRWLVGL
jgi:hypothetical protein